MFEEVGFPEAKKNIRSQASKLLHDIADAYSRGSFDDPNAAIMFCTLLALICEGKIKGIMNEDLARVEWTLTPAYEAELELLRTHAASAAAKATNVVKGPWA